MVFAVRYVTKNIRLRERQKNVSINVIVIIMMVDKELKR